MGTYLIGDEISAEFWSVNEELRSKTVAGYNAVKRNQVQWYSPWICIYPILRDDEEIPTDLLRQPVFQRGALVTDSGYLRIARDYMEPRREMTRNGIYDQKHSDWIPITSVTPQQASIFREGRELLLKVPLFAALYLEIVDFCIPLHGDRNRGYSTALSRGVIFRTIPTSTSRYDVAIDLAHELGHHVLNVWQSTDPIIKSDREYLVYSQIRRTLRPAIQTFHAAVALAFMNRFVQSLSGDAECREAGERRGRQYTESLGRSLEISLDALERECEFTSLGRRMLLEMRRTI